MIKAPKQTRQINSFVHVSIPSPRDLFQRYGERLGKGGYADDGLTVGIPINPGASTIEQMINAERLISAEVAKNSNN